MVSVIYCNSGTWFIQKKICQHNSCMEYNISTTTLFSLPGNQECYTLIFVSFQVWLTTSISLRSLKTVFIHVDQRVILEVTLMNCCLTSIIMDDICVYSAQAQGLLCEEAGNYGDNVKYCGYCVHHYKKLVRRATHRTMTVLTENTLVSLGLDSRYCRIYLTL